MKEKNNKNKINTLKIFHTNARKTHAYMGLHTASIKLTVGNKIRFS